MKKIAFALVAVSALGLAACQGDTEANNAADTNLEATANEANEDTGNALEAADNALDAAGNALENTGEALENAAEATGETVENAAEDAAH